jgi:hypothetical protein
MHDERQGALLGEAEDRGHRALDEGDDDDLLVGHVPDRQRDRDASQRHRPDRARRHHDLAAVVAVDEHARGQVEQQRRDGVGEADHAGLGRRAGQREDQQRERNERDLRAQRRGELGAPEHEEVAVSAQRDHRSLVQQTPARVTRGR